MARSFTAKVLLTGLLATVSADDNATAVLRRLQAGMPQACYSACPGLQSTMTSLQQQMSPQGPPDVSQPGAIGRMMEDTMNKVYDAMCNNKQAFKCLAANSNVCTPSDSGSTYFNDAANQVDCVCDACPALKRGYAKFYGVFMGSIMAAFQNMGSGNNGNAQNSQSSDDVTRGICSMTDGMECASQNQGACAAALSSGQAASALTSFKDNIPALKTLCSSRNFPMSLGAGGNTPGGSTQGGSQQVRRVERSDLTSNIGDFMMNCVSSAASPQAKSECRNSAKAFFANSTLGDTAYAGNKGQALFEKAQRGFLEKAAVNEVKSCLSSDTASRQAIQACMERARTTISTELDQYIKAGKTAAQKAAQKLQMQKEATRDVLGDVFSTCLRTRSAGQCTTILETKKAAAGLESEGTDVLLKRHFAKTLKGVSENCTSGDMQQCRVAAKQQALDNGMKRREYAQAKQMGDIKAAAELWASCKESGETDGDCESMIRDEFVRVSGAAESTFDQAMKEKVKRLGNAIKDGVPIVMVKFKRMLVDALTSDTSCTAALETAFANAAFNAAAANSSNVSRAIARACRVVDQAAEYGARVEVNIPDSEIEELAGFTAGQLGGSTLSRRLREAGVAGDLARRLATVDEAFAAQDMAECADGDTSCTSGELPPSPTPSPSPSTTSGAKRALAAGSAVLAAAAGVLLL